MSKSIRIVLEELHCSQTTELGEDEVYVGCIGGHSAKGNLSAVYPGANSHWDMNDNGDKIINKMMALLFIGNFNDGDQMLFRFDLQEQDGGGPQKYIDSAADLGLKSGNIYIMGASALAKLCEGFLPVDSDDALGSITLEGHYQNGQPCITWSTTDDYTRLVFKAEIEQRIANCGSDFIGQTLKKALENELPRYGDDENSPQQVIACTGAGSQYVAYFNSVIY